MHKGINQFLKNLSTFEREWEIKRVKEKELYMYIYIYILYREKEQEWERKREREIAISIYLTTYLKHKGINQFLKNLPTFDREWEIKRVKEK